MTVRDTFHNHMSYYVQQADLSRRAIQLLERNAPAVLEWNGSTSVSTDFDGSLRVRITLPRGSKVTTRSGKTVLERTDGCLTQLLDILEREGKEPVIRKEVVDDDIISTVEIGPGSQKVTLKVEQPQECENGKTYIVQQEYYMCGAPPSYMNVIGVKDA